jgi:hypothetical protein
VVNAFLTKDLLGQADPDANARDKKVTVEELLRKAAGKIQGNPKFDRRPEVEATLRLTLGKTLFKLSDIAESSFTSPGASPTKWRDGGRS